ncbi:MAG TPA: EF-hand domain-containing protein [Rhodocyclaceae bacterium]|nr:EF-hand domain-containing protein [Rhodocyclaceae bacterium]
MNIQKIVIVGAAICLSPLAAFAQDAAPGGSSGDGDRPTTYTRLTFADLDKNKDGAINEAEQKGSKLDAGLFKKMDVNADKRVSESEFDTYQAANKGNPPQPAVK